MTNSDFSFLQRVQTDRVEVKNRASDEHNRRDNDHTGTPVRERELEYQSNKVDVIQTQLGC